MKKRLILLAKTGLTLLLIGFLLQRIGWGNIRSYLLLTGTFRTMLPALALALLFNAIKIGKWRAMLQQTAVGSSWSIATASYLVGMAGGLITPGRIGEISRLLCLPRHTKTTVVGLTLFDRLLDVLVVMLLALPGLAHFAHPVLTLAIMTGVLLAVLLFVLRPTVLVQLLRLPWWGTLSSRLSSFFNSVSEWLLRLPPAEIGLWLSLSLIGYAVVMVEFFWLLLGLHPCSARVILLTQPLIMLTNIVPVTIAGIGVREGTSLLLLTTFGVPAAAAVAAAFQLFLLNTCLPALVGAVILGYSRGWGRRENITSNHHHS
jgi:uncharacterized membrane protein YbhN (UPF0104 family)